MSRPDFAFRTSECTVYPIGGARYRTDLDGVELSLTAERQDVPAAIASPEMERAVMAWVLARGARTLLFNGKSRPLRPDMLDRPALGPVRRLVSIAPSNAEIVGALGATGLLVGVESSSDFPPEICTLPRLGPDLAVDMDAVASLKPDLVLASLSVPGMERNIAELERRRLRYLVLAPQSVADICKDVLRIGAALGMAGAAVRVASNLDSQLAALRARNKRRRPVPVYLEWWPKPMFSPGAACWTNELIERAGGFNIFQHRAGQSGEVQVAEVAEANPAVILVAWCGVPLDKLNVQRVITRPGMESVRAVARGHVYAVDESLLGRPGPRVIEGAQRIAEAIEAAR